MTNSVWILRPHSNGKCHLFEPGKPRSLCGTARRYYENELHVGPGYDPCELCMRIEENRNREECLAADDSTI